MAIVITSFVLGISFFSTTKKRILSDNRVIALDSKHLSTKVSFYYQDNWNLSEFDDSNWEAIKLPHYDYKESRFVRDGNPSGTIYYRLKIDVPSPISSSKNEISFSPAYIAFDQYEVYVNGELRTSGNGKTARGAHTTVSLTKHDLKSSKLIVGIKGEFSKDNVGLMHRSQLLLGPSSLINELAIHKERVMITYYFFWILPLGTLLILFSLLYLTTSSNQSYKFLIQYILLIIIGLLVSSDFFAEYLSIHLRLAVLCGSIILAPIVLMRSLNFVCELNKYPKGASIIEIGASLLGISIIILSIPSINVLTIVSAIKAAYLINKLFILSIIALTIFAQRNNTNRNEKSLNKFLILSLCYLFTTIYFVYGPFSYYLTLPDLLLCVYIAYINVRIFSHHQKELLHKEQELKELAIKAAVGDTAREMAHDLKQPFSLISTVLENFEIFGQSPKELSKVKREVQSSLDQVKTMVNDIVSNKQLKGIDHFASVAEVLSQIIKKENFAPHNAQIAFNYDIKSSQCPLIERIKLSRVLGNIIENGIEAIDEIGNQAKGTITINTYDIYEFDLPKIVIEVSNSGPWIPTKALNEIFKSGFTAGKENGHGIGLSSVKRILERVGGEIIANNDPFGGVTFTIKLPPSQKQENLTAELPISLEVMSGTDSTNSTSYTIHIIDDSTITRDYLSAISKELLEIRGNAEADVYSYRSKMELLDNLSESSKGILLCDLNLEEDSGLDVIKHVRKLVPTLNCYIMTNHFPSELMSEAKELGVKEILIQPISSEKLESVFQQSGL